MAVLVTGAAGFIGFHVAQALLARGERVVGIDNLNAYYEVRLKEARLAQLSDAALYTASLQVQLAQMNGGRAAAAAEA